MSAGLSHLRLTLDSQGPWVQEAVGGQESGWDTLSRGIRRRGNLKPPRGKRGEEGPQ